MKCFKTSFHCSNSGARTGLFKTAHGSVKTPFFMPVATKGAVKNVLNDDLTNLGFECIISNAFINYLKPGLSIINQGNGLHNFMSWEKSLFTDSGGFQLILDNFSPKISDSGVVMINPFSKQKELISPEKAIEIQNILGSDVAMCLDHQPVFGVSKKDYLSAVNRTIDWAFRCKQFHDSNSNKTNPNQLLFGIIQGGNYSDLRIKCAESLLEMNFDALALGGFGIGEAQKDMYRVVKNVKKILPVNNLTYVMGIGSPIEILNCVELGVDCFDSAFPTRMARHGVVFTSVGKIEIDKSVHKNSFVPLDSSCECFVCKNHSRAFLHHLFKTYEQNAHILLSYHNLFFISNLMKNIRESIKNNSFLEFKQCFEKNYLQK